MMQQQLLEQLDFSIATLPFSPWWLRWWCITPVAILFVGIVVYFVYRYRNRAPEPILLSPAERIIDQCMTVDAALADESISTKRACVSITVAVKVYLGALQVRPCTSMTDQQIVEQLRVLHNNGLVDTEFYGILKSMLEDFYAVKFADQPLEVPVVRERIHQLVGCVELAAQHES